jgi:hypothetical protein
MHRSEASTQIRGSYTNPKLLYRITNLITRSTMVTAAAKLIKKEQFNDLPPPPHAPSWCVTAARVVENHVIGVHKAQPWQVEYIQGFLSERYLLSLPRLSEDTRVGIDTSRDHLRWLWFLWSAKLLGLLKSGSEWEDRFSQEVRRVLWDSVFLFPKVECS